jgi:hypothetical protein
VDVILVDSRAEHILVLLLRLEDKWVVELEDVNIHGAIVVVERVKQALVGANAHANVPEDASVLPALAVRVKDSAALKDAAAKVVGVRFYTYTYPYTYIYFIISVELRLL